MVRVRGSYALELMFRDYPGEIWVARKDSPMIIGIADGETYVASDHIGVRPHKEKINISKEIINKTRRAVAPYAARMNHTPLRGEQ